MGISVIDIAIPNKRVCPLCGTIQERAGFQGLACARCVESEARGRPDLAQRRRASFGDVRQRGRARALVADAIKRGRLRRPHCCSSCEKECKPEAHHYRSYLDEDALLVRWYCRKCHCAQDWKQRQFLAKSSVIYGPAPTDYNMAYCRR